MTTLLETTKAVIEQVQNEREALTEFYDENTRLTKENQQLRAALAIAEKIVNHLATQGTLFLDARLRNWMEQVRAKLKEMKV